MEKATWIIAITSIGSLLVAIGSIIVSIISLKKSKSAIEKADFAVNSFCSNNQVNGNNSIVTTNGCYMNNEGSGSVFKIDNSK